MKRNELIKTYAGQLFEGTLNYVEKLVVPKKRIIIKKPIVKEVPEEDVQENIFGIKEEKKKVVASVNKRTALSDYIFSQDLVEGVAVKILVLCEQPKDYVAGGNEDLLSKMLGALRCSHGEIVRFFLNREDGELLNLFSNDLNLIKPKRMITFGAYPTSLLMKEKVKLTKVRGKKQNFSFNLEGVTQNFSFYPIFHPDFLNINPNMKRAAWEDLQKVLSDIE